MHSGSGRLAVKQKSAVSVYVGIAALVLEGRGLGYDDDEYVFLGVNQSQLHSNIVVDGINAESTPTSSSSSRHSVIERISEKLMRLRQFPGVSKDVIETSVAIPVNARDECDYERQPRLHHVASAREFNRNPRVTSFPASSTSNSSSAASVLHDIDVDWNDISIVLNGLDSIINVPSFQLKIPSNHGYRSSMPSGQEASLKLCKNKATEKSSGSLQKSTTKPKQGPHCEKFLKKIGLVKLDTSEQDIDHLCNHVNSYCRRWQFHLKKLLQVLSKGEDACIEVYLGPENNAILLEQWIMTISDKPSSTTMTIQSLCSAIRSQLYFSQISSWIDLLKKAFVDGDLSVKDQMPSLFSPEIMQNPRLKKNLETMQVDLDILFRIKPYDGTSCFNEKPNVHNFPDAAIIDGIAICVCLKTLPRLDKIPTLNTEKANLNGFLCDNRIKSPFCESPVASSSRHVIHERFAFSSCHEKGKHRCKDEDEEDEVASDENVSKVQDNLNTANPSSAPDNAATIPQDIPPQTSTSGLTHRERQLLKYKKRLMKREKQKKKQHDSDSSSSNGTESKYLNTAHINNMEIPLYDSKSNNNAADVQMDGKPTAISLETTNNSKHTLTSLSTIATQTEFNDTSQHSYDQRLMVKCDSCGSHLQCLNCDKIKLNNFNQMASPLSINIASPAFSAKGAGAVTCTSAASDTMIGNKADLLLQAIQRTAFAHQTDDVTSDTIKDNIFSSNKIIHIRDSSDADNISECDNGRPGAAISKELEGDCRCKRQKTKHNYTVLAAGNTGNVYRRTMSECTVGLSPDNDTASPSDLFQSFHNCDENSNITVHDGYESLSYGELKAYRRAFSEDVINQLPNETCCFENSKNSVDDDDDDDDCLTIKCHERKASPVHKLKLTPNVTLQQQSVLQDQEKYLNSNQKIPKINLSHVFEAMQPPPAQNDSGIGHDTFDFSPTTDNVFVFNSPVKSYPPSMQLSPRPYESASVSKRRSRHISDRSSISEYCSDDDDEVMSRCQLNSTSSAKISSLYKKFVTKAQTAFNKFSKLPLLATIEENLLHNRFQPKAIVDGFKLLLGASGSFCPTQLTIPAQTYFYEFQGVKHISTPYVCEFRLTRKYSIPRSGTVQATLLNPQGTVVRMFFVPYDFRDMPTMSQTFIRQRILAIDEQVSQKSVEQMCTSEQMKYLRYVINLRFQTGRSGRLCLHTDIKLIISRRTEFDTAAAHAKNSLESPNDLKTVIIAPESPKFSSRNEKI